MKDFKLWQIGKEVSFSLPVLASTIRPTRKELKETALKLKIPMTLAKRALDHYNYD